MVQAVRVIEPSRGALFISQLSRQGHADLQPPHAPSAGDERGVGGCGVGAGWGGRIRISVVTSRQRRTDGRTNHFQTHEAAHLRARSAIQTAAVQCGFSYMGTFFGGGAQVVMRIALPPCLVLRRLHSPPCTSSSPALVDLPPPPFPSHASVCHLSIKPSSIPANAAPPSPRRDPTEYIPSAALIEFPSRSPIILRNQKPSAW